MTARDFTPADALAEAHATDELTTCPIFDALSREVGIRRMRDAVRDGVAARVPWLRLVGGAES